MRRVAPVVAWLRGGSFHSNVALTVAMNVLISVLTVATGTVAARLLHPLGRGQLAAIQVMPAFIGTLAMLGLWESVVYIASSRPQASGRALASGIILSLATCPVFIAVGYFSIPFLLSAQTPAVIHATRWYLLLIPIYSVLFMPLHALRAGRSLVAWNIVRLMPVIGWLAVLVLAWATNHVTPSWIAGAYLVCLASLIVPTWAIALPRVSRPILPSLGLFKEMLKYGLPSAAGAIPQNLNLKLDQMLMSAMLPPRYLGLYVVAVAWSGAVGPIMSALAQPLLPKVASQDNRARRIALLAQVLRIAVAISAVLVLIIGALTPVVIRYLFGADYASAVPAAMVLVVAAGFSGVNYVLQEGVRGLADTPAVLFSEGTGLIFTAASLFLLLPTYGIMGAAIASLFGYSSTTTFLLARLRLKTGASFNSCLVARSSDFKLVIGSAASALSPAKPVSVA